MPMTLAPGQVAIGDHAYLLPSPAANMTDCLVLAHGGSIDPTRKFDVPANLVISFLADAGKAYSGPGPMGVYQKLWNRKPTPSRAQQYTGTRLCPDYILEKEFGTHWDFVGEQSTYVEAQRHMANMNNAAPGTGSNWLPHLITIRNRKVGKKNVWLSTLIADLVAAQPNITQVYCANCRSDVSAQYAKHRKTVGSGSLNSQSGR